MENIINLIPVDALAAVVLVLMVAVTLYLVVGFARRPKTEKLAVVQEWLLWAVARAESYLGGGTGEKKLAMVYSWFEVRFPLMCKVVTFDQFKKMVDDALDQLEEFLMDEAIMDMMLGEAEQDETV